MKNAIYLLIGTLLFSFSLNAKNLGLDISYSQYMTADNSPYVELYFALSGKSVVLTKNENNTYFGGIEVLVTFKQDSVVKAADKFRISTPKSGDTLSFDQILIQQERFSLPKGRYNLVMEIFDINNPEEKHIVNQKVVVYLGRDEVSSSDLTFLDHYSPATADSKYAKSGYDLIPLVSSGVHYFPESVEEISYYVELYNINKAIPDGEPYLLKRYIENIDNSKVVDKLASFSKKKAGIVEPVLSGFNIKELPTGNYNMVVEALDQKGKSIFKKEQFFFRNNNSVKPLAQNAIPDDIAGTFVATLNNFDSLYLYIKYLYPISVESEQDFQKGLLASRDKQKMRNYFYAFWVNKNSQNPEGQWKDYHSNVKIANKQYGTRIEKGYMSTLGRVFLVYGKPYLIEDRRFEPSLPPYQIWQYGVIDSPYVTRQTNKIFVFAQFQPSTNDYELIHSTAFGEFNNRRWQYDLAQGIYGAGGGIDDNSINSGDNFGSRLNNNMIFRSGGQ